LEPGFKRYELRPQFADLADLDATAFTVIGPISVRSQGSRGSREVMLNLPSAGQGELVVPVGERIELPPASGPTPAGHRRYGLPQGQEAKLHLKFA